MATVKPVVLVIAGHDPVGGAGVQADIEAVAAQGCHAATAITALTVQDTRNVSAFTVTDSALLAAQLDAILGDLRPAAVKIGMIGSADNARVIAGALRRLPGVPVVLDPVLVAGGGGSLALDDLQQAMTGELFPLATIVTPNGPEAETLGGDGSPDAAARAMIAAGARCVLITGGHESGTQVVSRLYDSSGRVAEHASPRLPGDYHGSGCTLAATIAARLAQGAPVAQAVEGGLRYMEQALRQALRPGRGQAIPGRFFHLPARQDTHD
ncbi:MAG: hydroxymethylpyrimidine/phosphomethylpyrimidine kinase [Gammaproteobacteria bacterium]